MTAFVATAVVGLALAALAWLVAIHTGQEQRDAVRDQAEQTLMAQAATIAETVDHELLLIDQSLAIIQAAWQRDSDQVDLDALRRTMPVLTQTTDDLFISDDRHIIHQDILPRAVGQEIGAGYVMSPHGSLEQYSSDGARGSQSLLPRGDRRTPIEARQFPMYLVRPLDHPDGWLVGASYKSRELIKLFAHAALGDNAVVALVDTRRGVLQAVVGSAARRPKTDLAKTPLFAILNRSPSGTWLGETAIDEVERLHAFHHVGDRDLVVLVAQSWSQVVAPADDLAASALALAALATAMITAIGALMLREFCTVRARQQQKRLFERNKTELARLRQDAAAADISARLDASRLQVLLHAVSDGIALLDGDLRLVQWNGPFLLCIGVSLRLDMPLDTLLRQQAAAGLFAAGQEIELEVARRVALLRTGDPDGLPQPGPDHQVLSLHGHPVNEGGLVLRLHVRHSCHPAMPPDNAEVPGYHLWMPAPIGR